MKTSVVTIRSPPSLQAEPPLSLSPGTTDAVACCAALSPSPPTTQRPQLNASSPGVQAKPLHSPNALALCLMQEEQCCCCCEPKTVHRADAQPTDEHNNENRSDRTLMSGGNPVQDDRRPLTAEGDNEAHREDDGTYFHSICPDGSATSRCPAGANSTANSSDTVPHTAVPPLSEEGRRRHDPRTMSHRSRRRDLDKIPHQHLVTNSATSLRHNFGAVVLIALAITVGPSSPSSSATTRCNR